jgi:hypothetical protein
MWAPRLGKQRSCVANCVAQTRGIQSPAQTIGTHRLPPPVRHAGRTACLQVPSRPAKDQMRRSMYVIQARLAGRTRKAIWARRLSSSPEPCRETRDPIVSAPSSPIVGGRNPLSLANWLRRPKDTVSSLETSSASYDDWTPRLLIKLALCLPAPSQQIVGARHIAHQVSEGTSHVAGDDFGASGLRLSAVGDGVVYFADAPKAEPHPPTRNQQPTTGDYGRATHRTRNR